MFIPSIFFNMRHSSISLPSFPFNYFLCPFQHIPFNHCETDLSTGYYFAVTHFPKANWIKSTPLRMCQWNNVGLLMAKKIASICGHKLSTLHAFGNRPSFFRYSCSIRWEIELVSFTRVTIMRWTLIFTAIHSHNQT